MMRSLPIALALLAGLGLFALHGASLRPERRLDAPQAQAAPPPRDGVMIVVVRDDAAVRMVRDAVDPDRIVANALDGFAVREGWLVVSAPEAAGPLLALAGWSEAALEIVRPAPRGTLPPAAAPGAQPGRLASLLAKPTLTVDEALGALALVE
jgi:hypothetical protein